MIRLFIEFSYKSYTKDSIIIPILEMRKTEVLGFIAI